MGLHFWFKRIAFNRQILGGPERCREEAAILQGWAPRAQRSTRARCAPSGVPKREAPPA
jgi:hypothetical protein